MSFIGKFLDMYKSEQTNKFIPILKANTENNRFDIPFPDYIKSEFIGVNVKALTKLLRIGGISHLRVDGETSQFTPTIVGHDLYGNSYAGNKGQSITIPEFTTSEDETHKIVDPSLSKPHSATWKNALITLNSNEMAERIRSEKKWKKGIHSTEAWSFHLDKVIRDGITRIGVNHLTLGLNKQNWASVVFQYVFMGGWEILEGHPSVEGMIFRVPTVSGILNLMDYFKYRNKDDGYRWSAFYGPQIDRAIILKFMTSKTTLVKNLPINNDELKV